jgi:hypothetical protein
MFGLRIAAELPRPSRTKKGKLVGFDPTQGYRFSTYARSYADKEMRAALVDDPGPALNPEFEQKATAAIETWGEASEEEWKEEDDAPLDFHGRLLLIRDLRFRSAYHKPLHPWTPWKPQRPERKPKPRNFRKHSITATELQNKDVFYKCCLAILQTFEDTAAAGIEGWQVREDEDQEMWFPPSGAFDRKLYKLPKEVLLRRWRLGCKRQGKITPFKSNQGLGLFDKFGNQLAICPTRTDDTCVRLKFTYTPFLCLKPLASIYLVRGEVISLRRFAFYRDLPRMEMNRWVTQRAPRASITTYRVSSRVR